MSLRAKRGNPAPGAGFAPGTPARSTRLPNRFALRDDKPGTRSVCKIARVRPLLPTRRGDHIRYTVSHLKREDAGMTNQQTRRDGRRWDQTRPVRITVGCQPYAEGSAMIEMGDTAVLCAASVEDEVPRWMRGRGTGWVTAEYDMLPRATSSRRRRDRDSGQVASRSQEIQRLIGRSLRAATDLSALGERAIFLDCDVLQADGGTRTAAITGAYVALQEALRGLVAAGKLDSIPIRCAVAAISVGIRDGALLLDLDYSEDSTADADFNVVMTDAGDIVEIQATAEGEPFPRRLVGEAIALAANGMETLFTAQRTPLL